MTGKGDYRRVRDVIQSASLNTVCVSARCPNIGECWARRTATFLIMGNICTRNCRFCAVESGRPRPLDPGEPARIARAVRELQLKYAVVTSVTRDDLPDGGARHFAETIRHIKKDQPQCRVEVLIPDFKGSTEALEQVLQAGPEVLNHNIETVPRLYKSVRPQADYSRSLAVLKNAKAMGAVTKSGMMVGLGETSQEIAETMHELRGVGCDIFTIGQYMQPSKDHLAIECFVHPEEFDRLKRFGIELGFSHVESGPLVRSSYHADAQYRVEGSVNAC
jgi:lipoic acid synthetase